MQKRSHKLLASALLREQNGFGTRSRDLAFLFGSFQPDCNPLSYLKGSLHFRRFHGHDFPNSQRYIDAHIRRLQRRSHWTVWQYYTLGKLTHYLADAFTYPHNAHWFYGMQFHHQYESGLRRHLATYLRSHPVEHMESHQDVVSAIRELHRQYCSSAAGVHSDTRYILRAMALLMAGCFPGAALSQDT